ncbi:MAG: hypothetical protein KA763_05240 [Xanthomonadales bacterium]|nr:hypothetical protein [Xanthomonadales bacterium]
MLTVTPPLFLIETSLICWWCVEPITVVAIVARRASLLTDGDELPYGEDADEYLLLTHVESLPESLLAEIQVHAPTYSRSSVSTGKRNCFSNICAHCNAVQEDRHVHHALDQGSIQTDDPDSPEIRLIALGFAERFQTEASVGSNSHIRSLLQRHLGLPPH